MATLWQRQVALRLLGSRSANRMMSFIGVLSIGGLALAVAVLITVLSVVNGFERELRERVLAVLPQGTVYPRNGFEDWQATRLAVLENRRVLGAAPVIEGAGLAVGNGELTGVEFRGVDPELEPGVSILPQFITSGSFDELGKIRFGAVLGAELAGRLGVGVGDSFSLALPDVRFSLGGPVITTRQLNVVGIFEVGADVDKSQVLVHIGDARRLKRQVGIDGIVIKTGDLFAIHEVLHELMLEDPSLYAMSWMRQNGNLYDAIGTQKATLFLLLMILVAVAAFNVVSNLVMTVDENRAEIAILRTMGASPAEIRLIFIMHGALVGAIGIVIGLLAGVLLTWSLEYIYATLTGMFHLSLMQEYFIRYLPTEVRVDDLLAITAVTFLIALVATIYPASRAARLSPAKVLQYDV